MHNLLSRTVGRSRLVQKIRYYGHRRHCPICESNLRRFTSFGLIPRPEARCPVCGSLERHRLDWTFFRRYTGLFDGKPKRMLHVAPEAVFARKFGRLPGLDYVTADLFMPNVTVKMDITDIPFPEDSFDVIYCSHVLEHVPDDRQAMRELRRVLKPDGWAVIQVPITADVTFEDPSITDPAERVRLFGQDDHVRRYGPDYEDRLKEAGFKVQRFGSAEVVGAENVRRYGVMPQEDVYLCTK